MCMHTVIHMYSQDQPALALPNIRTIQETLHTDYKNYLKKQLEEYKANSICSVETLVTMGGKFQNIEVGLPLYPNDNIAHDIIDTADNQGNHFLHIAVEKEDIDSVRKLSQIKTHSVVSANKINQTPLDLCIAKLLSNTANHDNAKMMLEEILYRSAHISRSSVEHTTYLEESLKKVIHAQLIYKQQSKNLDISPILLAKLTKSPIAKDEVKKALSPFYQQATNQADGNTFTHALVNLELADELHEWIQDGRVSFAQNHAGLTPVDIVLARFRSYLHNPELIDSDKEVFQKRKCCLFMLLEHLKNISQQSLLKPFQQCCDLHRLHANFDEKNKNEEV